MATLGPHLMHIYCTPAKVLQVCGALECSLGPSAHSFPCALHGLHNHMWEHCVICTSNCIVTDRVERYGEKLSMLGSLASRKLNLVYGWKGLKNM